MGGALPPRPIHPITDKIQLLVPTLTKASINQSISQSVSQSGRFALLTALHSSSKVATHSVTYLQPRYAGCGWLCHPQEARCCMIAGGHCRGLNFTRHLRYMRAASA